MFAISWFICRVFYFFIFPHKKLSPPPLLLYTLKIWVVWIISEFLNLGTSNILSQYSFIMGGYLADSLASLLWIPVAFPLPLHQRFWQPKMFPEIKITPVWEPRGCINVLLCLSVNMCAGQWEHQKDKMGREKSKIKSLFPQLFIPCQISAGRPLLHRSQLLPGCPLHTALAFSLTGSFSLAHLPTTLCPKNLPVLI